MKGRAAGSSPPAARSWHPALAAFLTVRLTASALAALAATLIPAEPVLSAGSYAKPAYPPWTELLLGVWERSDALWYLHLARDGYQPGTQGAAFFPLFPWLVAGAVKLFGGLGLSPLGAALVISNLGFLVALLALHRLTELELGREVADRAVWYQALFPGAVFCLAPYSESLYLALACGAFLAAREQRAWAAGLLGAGMALTRSIGATALLPLTLVAWPRGRGAGRQLLWLGLIPLGLGGTMWLGSARLGDPLAFLTSQSAWSRQPEWPWVSLLGGLAQAREHMSSPSGGIYLFEALALLFALGCALLCPFRLPPGYTAFLWIGLLFPLSVPYPGNYLMSFPRFVAVLFPCFMILASFSRSSTADGFIRGLLGGLSGLAVALYVSSRGFF